MRYWTSDWHLNSEIVRQTSHRPWKTAEEMNVALLKTVVVKTISDQVIHVGDLIQAGKDRGTEIAKAKQLTWDQIARTCACQLICVEGNHDYSNDVPFICCSMKTRVGNYNVTVGHYPTWYKEAAGTFAYFGHSKTLPIHICGHVHKAWKVAFDTQNCVLNINVGIDAHKYKLLSDADLVKLISRGMQWYKYMNTYAEYWFGDGYSFADWEKNVAKQKATKAADKHAKMLEWLKANKPEIYEAKMKRESK